MLPFLQHLRVVWRPGKGASGTNGLIVHIHFMCGVLLHLLYEIWHADAEAVKQRQDIDCATPTPLRRPPAPASRELRCPGVESLASSGNQTSERLLRRIGRPTRAASPARSSEGKPCTHQLSPLGTEEANNADSSLEPCGKRLRIKMKTRPCPGQK